MRPCPVCCACSAEPLHTQGFEIPEGAGLPPTYDVVCCNICGMCYADTSASQADYDAYYSTMSRYVHQTGMQTVEDDARFSSLAKWFGARFPRGIRVLDVGGARGGFQRAMREQGFTDVSGIDPIGDNRGTVADIAGEYDLIVMLHVMEHICDVDGAMRALTAHLSNVGHLYVETPDASRYAEHYVVPFYYFDAEHINHFSPQSLENLGRRYGLAVHETIKNDDYHGELWFPAVGTLFQQSLTYSSTVRNNILRYVAMSRRGVKVIDGTYAVWGAGSYAQRLFAGEALNGAVALVDSNPSKHGTVLHGLTVEAPEALAGRGLPVVICSVVRAQEITACAIGLGLDILAVLGA
jgi:hypothetical protein